MALSRSATAQATGDPTGDKTAGDFLFNLPTELMVHVASFMTARDKVKLRYVSKRLRSVIETPSLWGEFVWPYYHTGDEGCVNNVLKVCGQHVKRLSIHVSAGQDVLSYYDELDEDWSYFGAKPGGRLRRPKLLEMLCKYCSDVLELSLIVELERAHIQWVLLRMKYLQKLDIHWCYDDIEQLLKVIGENNKNLKELVIRPVFVLKSKSRLYGDEEEEQYNRYPWVRYWISSGFVPQNVIITHFGAERDICSCWIMLNTTPDDTADSLKEYCQDFQPPSSMPAGRTGCIKLYSRCKAPLNLCTFLPTFYLEFGRTHTTPVPYKKLSDFGILGLREMLVMLIDGIQCGKVVHKASFGGGFLANLLRNQKFKLNSIVSFLESVIEFDFLHSKNGGAKHLEQLALVCPNLQRLSLQKSLGCLKSLQGLRAIADSCRNLQGLNLLGIPVTEVECQVNLWQVLSDMKQLTHLAVDLCVLLPSTNNKHILVSLFQKCRSLQALESKSFCEGYRSQFVYKSLVILSHFPSLVHCRIDVGRHHDAPDVKTIYPQLNKLLDEAIISSKELQCLFFASEFKQSLSALCNHSLQQLYIDSFRTSVPDTFMSAISAHGGLVHVVFNVRSVTVEGITVLVTNSPKLITFHSVMHDGYFCAKEEFISLKASLMRKFPHRQLFTAGSYIAYIGGNRYQRFHCITEEEQKCNTNLFSLWPD